MGFFKTKVEYFNSVGFNHVPFSIVWGDLNRIIVYCNSATEEIFGSRKEELIRTNFLDLFLDSHAFLEEKYRTLLKGDGGHPIEIQ